MASDWPLLTGGHYSEVVIRIGLTVESNLSTTPTLGTPRKWSLYIGGHSVEVLQ
jgi:hypothetical protein